MLRAVVAASLAIPALYPRACREALAQGGDPKTQRLQRGDRFAFQSGDRTGQAITVGDLQVNGSPVSAFPLDPGTGVTRDGSRLNQVLLVRFGPTELSDETRGRAADGVVAYSGVCTHAGCDVTVWKAEQRRFRCPCHESEFDPRDAGRVVGGPAPRRLPAVPVKIVEGYVVADGGFTGRPGFQPG